MLKKSFSQMRKKQVHICSMETEAPKRGRKGKAESESLKSQAEYLFLNTAMTQEAIAKWVGVTGKTMSEWVNEKGGGTGT
jgi:hypothetical protein